MAEPTTYIDVAANVAIRMMHFQNAEDTHNGHIHNFDHLSILSNGSIRVEFNDGVQEYTAPCVITVPKLVRHKFIAKENNTILSCVHAVRDGNGIDDVAPQDVTEQVAVDLLVRYPILLEY